MKTGETLLMTMNWEPVVARLAECGIAALWYVVWLVVCLKLFDAVLPPRSPSQSLITPPLLIVVLHVVLRVWCVLMVADVSHRALSCLSLTVAGRPIRPLEPMVFAILVLVTDPGLAENLEDLRQRLRLSAQPPAILTAQPPHTTMPTAPPAELPYEWMKE